MNTDFFVLEIFTSGTSAFFFMSLLTFSFKFFSRCQENVQSVSTENPHLSLYNRNPQNENEDEQNVESRLLQMWETHEDAGAALWSSALWRGENSPPLGCSHWLRAEDADDARGAHRLQNDACCSPGWGCLQQKRVVLKGSEIEIGSFFNVNPVRALFPFFISSVLQVFNFRPQFNKNEMPSCSINIKPTDMVWCLTRCFYLYLINKCE